MRIVKIRFKKGVRKPIKETQKVYNFICPLQNIEVGEYVLCEVKNKKSDDFKVGRVEEIFDMTEEEIMISKPYSFIVSKVPVKDFNKRCREITNMKFKRFSKYNGTYHQKIKKNNC